MRLSLRDSTGVEIKATRTANAKEAPWEAMLLLAGCVSLEAGFILVVDDDNVPNFEESMVRPTVTTANLMALASRLEVRAEMLAEDQPGNAMDLRLAATLARHAVKVRWVLTSVALSA